MKLRHHSTEGVKQISSQTQICKPNQSTDKNV